MNTQGWFPLGLTGLISLQSKWLSSSFSNTTVWKHQFLSAQPSLWFNSHIHTWLLERERKVAQSCPTLCNPMDCSLPGSSVCGIFQARVLEWGAITFSVNQNWYVLIAHLCLTLCDLMDCSLPGSSVPEFLTHKIHDKIHVYCFNLLSFGVICYTAIDN